MDFRSIGGIERGERNLTLDTLARILKALDVPPADIFQSVARFMSKQEPPTRKDQMLQELTSLLKRKSDDDVRLALELVKTLLRHKRGKGTGQERGRK